MSIKKNPASLPIVEVQQLGLMSYAEAWAYQQKLQQQGVAARSHNRKIKDDSEWIELKNYLLFCQHPHVYTLGKSGSVDHLLLNEAERAERNVEYFKINRGGDITYHGPGQIVAYPIFDLEQFFTDVHRYVRSLEEVVIATLVEYGVVATRIKGYTGVWLAGSPNRKICAIGVHMSRWVTLHGFAFNINTDLDYFKHIVPCGIDDADKSVTSLAAELGRNVEIEEVKAKLLGHFSRIFGFRAISH